MSKLEVEESPRMQEIGWRIQQVGALAIVLLVIASFMGVFGGGGAFSQKLLRDEAAGVQLEYERFARFTGQAELRIQLEEIEEASFQIRFDPTFHENFEIKTIQPEPEQVRFEANVIVYEFRADESVQDAVVNFILQAKTLGSIKTMVQAGESLPMELGMFVYP